MQHKSEKIKAGVPFVRFYGNDWYTGCAGLKADERGVYISMCVFIWTTGKRVPLDDAESARMLNLNFKSYQRVRDRLVVLGKVTRHDDGYGNERAERELQAAHGGQPRRAEPNADERQEQGGAEADPGLRQEASEGTETDRTLLIDHTIDHAIDHRIDHVIEVEKSEEILRANKEPITNNQEKNPQTPTGAFDDMPSHVKPMPSFAPVDDYSGVVRSESGMITLVNGTRKLWLDKFGGNAERLDAALIEISGAINEGSRKPLAADVQGRLGRILGQKLDSDQRYRSAVTARATKAETDVRPGQWDMTEVFAQLRAMEASGAAS